MAMNRAPTVLLESHRDPTEPSFLFSDLGGVVEAREGAEVLPALDAIEQAVSEGYHAAGFLSYEAASGLDAAMRTQPAVGMPLVWFGLFRERCPVTAGAAIAEVVTGCGRGLVGDWRQTMSRTEYAQAVARIHEYIAAGDTYQVNFTTRLTGAFRGDAFGLYRALCRAQRSRYCGYVDLGSHAILSASPELFFSLEQGRLNARPMKGTRPRGRWEKEDRRLRDELVADPKERAENVMIVDLLRNDLGRVSMPGSVRVDSLWQTERYETVWQLVSEISSELRPGVALRDLLAALFPCGSVTGAPKVRTMEIIAELESGPRGVYTGCIGYFSPGGDNRDTTDMEARFSVAIRTVCLDRIAGRVEYGVGGGVTHYSREAGEFEECSVKARILSDRRPEFDLLETLLYEADGGYYLFGRHMERLCASARYFDFECDVSKISDELNRCAASLVAAQTGADPPERFRVRLTLTRTGEVALTSAALTPSTESLRTAVARDPVCSDDVFLCHKTTHRQVYDEQRAIHGDCDEVLLHNERGEVTEGTVGNLVVVSGGRRWTPPRDCGLLPGTYRGELLEKAEIEERVISVDELFAADELFLINSVRRWTRLTLVAADGFHGDGRRATKEVADVSHG